ncbi:PREDICTED: uncharacterized protein LOC108362414 [Rhagoletis zephyria]|uniref:uncharacterized protein LOC108362414 n=1 Tax=Rhagoletis zephyria TaxID=28612 RepID=UPI0008118C39|nr:PREDICTED: uncharacterized protein LOC108362414 [Rhagoletis zephyria]
MEMCGVYAYTQFVEIERSLPAPDDKKQPRVAQVRAYYNILQKLCVLLQVDYDVLDTLESLVRTLHARLVEKPQLQELSNKHEIFIDVYAIELLVNGCIKLSRSKDLTKSSEQWLGVQIHALETYLLDALTYVGVKTMAQMYRLKTCFICLVNLYCTFHNTTGVYKLPLNLRSYHILLQTLLAGCLQRKPQTSASVQSISDEYLELNPKYVLQYQKLMFEKFTKLHSSKYVELPSPAAWKICLHYGLVSTIIVPPVD